MSNMENMPEKYDLPIEKRQPPVDMRRLLYFVAVAEELHFGKAAARLGISQPPLSEQILALEAQLGTRLFERSKRSVHLTPSGQLLYDEATKLLAHGDRVRQLMNSARKGEAGPLHVGCVPSSLFGALPALLQDWHQADEGLEVTVTEGHTAHIIAAVADGQLDAGLVWENQAPAPLSILELERVRVVAALHAAHPLCRHKLLSFAQLAPLPLVLPPRAVSPHLYDLVHKGFRMAGASPRMGQSASSIPSQIGYVACQLGYTFVPEYTSSLSVAGVAYRPVRDVLDTMTLSLVWNNTRPSSQLQRFCERARAVFCPSVPAAAVRRKRKTAGLP